MIWNSKSLSLAPQGWGRRLDVNFPVFNTEISTLPFWEYSTGLDGTKWNQIKDPEGWIKELSFN